MSAYLVAYLARDEDGKAKLLGLDIFSEENPTHERNRKTAVIMNWPGDDFSTARAGLLAHLEKVAPWLLPERNDGRR